MLKLAASKFKPRNRAVKLKLFGPFIPDNGNGDAYCSQFYNAVLIARY